MRKLPQTAAEDLLELVMRRYEKASTLITSNRPVEDWGKLLGDTAPSPRCSIACSITPTYSPVAPGAGAPACTATGPRPEPVTLAMTHRAFGPGRRLRSSEPYLDIPRRPRRSRHERLARSRIDRGTTLVLGARLLTGRFCPVHNWPVFRCPPRHPRPRRTERAQQQAGREPLHERVTENGSIGGLDGSRFSNSRGGQYRVFAVAGQSPTEVSTVLTDGWAGYDHIASAGQRRHRPVVDRRAKRIPHIVNSDLAQRSRWQGPPVGRYAG